jgi:hypothetical protein
MVDVEPLEFDPAMVVLHIKAAQVGIGLQTCLCGWILKLAQAMAALDNPAPSD